MKKYSIAIGIVLLLVLASIGLFFVRNVLNPTSAPNATSTNPFGPGVNSATTSSTLQLKLGNGGEVAVPDFTKKPQPAWATTNQYSVSGDPTASYLITYVPADSHGGPSEFLISLQSEPLGATRLQAEQALKRETNLTNSQLCMLDVRVTTQPGLSDIYDGENLGLGFCPGAVQLP
jgi:hypothetical protein